MNRPITGFHRDPAGHWVAELDCRHCQHVRHDPPWQVRDWVLTEAGRRSRIGTPLNCVLCDAEVLPDLTPAEAAAYRDARLQGLCHEGALEAAYRRRFPLDPSLPPAPAPADPQSRPPA